MSRRVLSAGLLAGLLPALVFVTGSASMAAQDAAEVARAKYLWSQSPHGKLLERILPPSIAPAELPEPHSEGARLMVRYCVQCHYLPSPQMHSADKWTIIVVRMVWRMRGKGNLGTLMKEMMDRVEAPGDARLHRLAGQEGLRSRPGREPRAPEPVPGGGGPRRRRGVA